MLKIKKFLLAIMLIATIILAGCGYSSTDTCAPTLECVTSFTEAIATVVYEPDTQEAEESPGVSASLAPLHFDDVDELLAAIGLAKFSEFYTMGISAFNAPGNVNVNVNVGDFNVLQAITILYEPRSVRYDFVSAGISVHDHSGLTFHHGSTAGERANFIWARSIAAENATTDFFGRGAIAEFYVERNGITYAITEWVTYDTLEPDGWVVAWAQNGQAFLASLPASYTEEDVLAFCDAQSITSWELGGDAVSVSIQGMSNVRIFENGNGVMGFSDVGNEIIAIGNGLYRSGAVGFATGGGMERVGYRWLIDEATHRYQYVLQPGAYEFHVTGNNGNGQPQFLVQRFAGGDRIAVEDQSFGQTTVGFSLTVTSGTEENGFMPPPTLFTTIFNEDWRTTINIRFFLNGVLTAIPIEDIQLIADGVHVAEIRDFTVNVAGWQTETNAVFINKQGNLWQSMTVRVTAYGQTLTHHFVNNMFVPPIPVLTTTIFQEEWRTTINIRFFLDGVLSALPIEDVQLVADGVPVADIRDFTINVIYWQTEINAIFISKLGTPWQNMTVSITAYGQTLTYHFVNNMFVPPITITWNAMGGAVLPRTQQRMPGTQVGTLPTPSLPGYNFNGWWTTSSSGGTQIQSWSTTPDSNTTFFARWTMIPTLGTEECEVCGELAFEPNPGGGECHSCGHVLIILLRSQEPEE